MLGFNSGPLYRQHVISLGARQIRLLHIRPAASLDAQLEGTLSVCEVDNPDTAFEALSYVWGEQTIKNVTIAIDGYAVPITEGLASPLRHLRSPDRPRCVWVDAICINQVDTKEKADQVGIMGDIYKRSLCVNIWLPSPTATAASLDTTASLKTVILHIASGHFHNMPGYSVDLKTGQLTFEETDEFAVAWEGFRLMAESPWWTRAWTAQEAILPPTINFIYGTADACDYKTLSKAGDNHWLFYSGRNLCCIEAMALFPRSKMEDIGSFFDQVGHISARREAGKSRPFDGRDLFYIIMATFGGRSCLEPRDRIYSLWSQALHGSYRDHTPSYSQPLEGVFTEVFKCMIREAQNNPHLYAGTDFRVLYGRGFGPDAKRPSWVPDFLGGMSNRSVESIVRRLACCRLYRASGWKKSTLRVSGDELHLDGAYADRILAVGLPVRDAQVRTGCKTVFNQWRDMLLETGVGASREDLARLLCGDVYSAMETRVRKISKRTGFFLQHAFAASWVKVGAEIALHRMANGEKWRRAERGDYLRGEFDQLWADGDFDGVDDSAYIVTVITALMDRALYVTEGGRIGICAPHAKAEDEVWVVYGSKLPFVLRPIGGAYNLVGDCYLQGAMDGEFVGRGAHIVIK